MRAFTVPKARPVWSLISQRLLASSRLFVDGTTAPVLDPGRGRTKLGYFWAIARDDRPFGGSDPPAVAYTYAPGRGAEHARELLKDFNGVLQTDGYSAYKRLAKDRPNAIPLAHCWSHVRRRFYDLAKGGSAPIAQQAIAKIGAQDPANWKTADEARLIAAYVLARKATNMTHPMPRAERIADAVNQNTLSDDRGSFMI